MAPIGPLNVRWRAGGLASSLGVPERVGRDRAVLRDVHLNGTSPVTEPDPQYDVDDVRLQQVDRSFPGHFNVNTIRRLEDSRNPSGTNATTLGAWIQPCDNVNQQMWEIPQINQRMRTKATYGGSQRSLQAGANGSPTSKAPDNVLADPDQDAQRWIIEDQPS